MSRGKKNSIKARAFWAAGIILSFLTILSCGDGQETNESAKSLKKHESFTFFDIGVNTRLTDDIRSDLVDKLGNDAIENRNIIDLEINYPGFLKKYFPELAELNRELNYPPGERVDHNTFKLMYRYAQKQKVPFDYVELVFSNYTKQPILFRIKFQKDVAGIVAALKDKYGPPQLIDWKEENGNSMVWKKNKDLLIASQVPDQFGQHGYQIVIYFVDNLQELIATEKKEQEKREQERLKSGKTAF